MHMNINREGRDMIEDKTKVGDILTLVFLKPKTMPKNSEIVLPISRIPDSGKIVLLNRMNDDSYKIKEGDRAIIEVIIVKDTFVIANPIRVLGNVKGEPEWDTN